MNPAEQRARDIIDSLSADELDALYAAMPLRAGESQWKQAVMRFLAGLDSNDRERLAAIGMAAFEQYATSFPGPDTLAKNTARPHVKTAIDNLVIDVCTWS